MWKLFKAETAYYWPFITGMLAITFLFSILFFLFEPPEWETVHGLLFIGPMIMGGWSAIMRAQEQRDNFLLVLPVSHASVFLSRLLYFSVLIFSPYVVGYMAFSLKGMAPPLDLLIIPAMAKGLITLVVFQIQMDLSLKRLTEVQKIIAALGIGLAYIFILWALIFYESMTELLTDIGAHFVVTAILRPIHEAFDPFVAIIACLAIIGVNYAVFIMERDYAKSRT